MTIFTYDAESPLASWLQLIPSASPPALSAGNGRNGTTSMRFDAVDEYLIAYLIESDEWYIEVDYRADSAPASGNAPGLHVQHTSDGATPQIGWRVNTDMTISIYRGSTEVAQSVLMLSTATYYRIRFEVVIHDSSGVATVLVDDGGGFDQYATFAGDTKETATATANYVVWGHLENSGSATTHDFDNIAIAVTSEQDATGAANGVINAEIVGDLIALGISGSGAGVTYERTQFLLDPSWWDGTVTFWFEVVAKNTGTSAEDVSISCEGSTMQSITIPAGTSDWTRLARAQFTPTTGFHTYKILSPPANDGDVSINEARIIVVQAGGTIATVFFPSLAATAGDSTALDADVGGGDVDRIANHQPSGSYTTLSEATNCSYFKYVASEWETLSFIRFWTVMAGSFSGCVACLQDVDTLEILETETKLGTFTDQYLLEPFIFWREIPVSVFTNGHSYRIMFASTHPSRNAYIYNAGLHLVLNKAIAGNVYWRYCKYQVAGADVNSSRFLANISSFSNFSGIIEATAQQLDTTDGILIHLKSGGTDDTGTAGAAVASLNVDETKAVYRSIDISESIVHGNRYIASFSGSGSDVELQAAFFVIAFHSTSVNIITTCPLPEAEVGVPYSQQLEAEGGTAPYTWSITSGSLPAGVTMTPEGLISGTPTESGPFNITVNVTDSTQGAAAGGYFEVASTWVTTTGDTLAERQTTFANPTAGSAAFIADILSVTTSFHINRGVWSSVHVHATDSDPLVTVQGVQQQAIDLGWDTLRIPSSAEPPGEADGHVVVVNDDDPRFLWTMGGATKSGSTWSAFGIKKWARTAAAVGIDSAIGRGMGVMSAYDNSGGASTACRASADTALGAILKSELDAGVIDHALRWAYDGYRLLEGNPQPYPCVSFALGIDDRPNAGTMGQRLMLDPDINVSALDIGAHLKIILVAAQNYGFIQTDGVSDGESGFYAEKRDWTGYDFGFSGSDFSTQADFVSWFYGNCKEIDNPEAFAGENNGDDPP